MPNKIKILLAEDSKNDVKILRHNLTKGGLDFNLTLVQTPEDFTSNLISLRPDIVLSDYSMPQFNGMEALKIKELVYPNIPFIIVTGSLNEETAVECIKAGADDYVVKEHISAIVPAVLSALKKYDLEREKIKLQNEIAEREEKYRSIFSVSADAIIIVEKETGKIIDANEAACRLYKYSLAEFLELPYNRLLNIPIVNSPSFNNESGLVNYHLTKEGSLIPVELSFSTYTQNSNSYLIINIRDISEKKRFSEKLRQNKEHLELLSAVIEQSPLSIVITGKDGIIEYVNPKFSEITGFSYNEAVGNSPATLDRDFNSVYNNSQLRETILSGKEWSGIFQNRKKNGEHFWESALIFPVKNELGEISDYIGIMEDITKRVETEKELENYRNHLEQMVTERTIKLAEVNKQLADNLEKEKAIEETVKAALSKEKELNELKSKFISTISHEFRTPLATILSSIELMELFGQKWNGEKQLKHILRIKESIKNLTSLLDEILTISRVETGKIKLNPETKDLNELCRKIINDTKDLSGRRHNVIYNFIIERNEFLIDEKLLKYILNNLLSNSVKYTSEGGTIELTVTLVKNDICFLVKDDGIGIPKKDQPHLFEPFFRANNCQNISGSGLGLSIVKNSVDLYNGKITFESRENKGSVFRVYIPVNNIIGVN